MRRDLRKQPWQTFPFWFLILSGVALLGAWHLDLLKPAAKPAVVEEGSAEEAPDWAAAEAEPEQMAAVEEQSEPVIGEEATPRSFPAESIDETQVAANDNATDSGLTASAAGAEEMPPADLSSEPSANEKPRTGNPFSTNQIRIKPVSGSRSIPSRNDPATRASANSPFGPTATEIRGVKTRGDSEPADSAEEAPASVSDAESPTATKSPAEDDPVEELASAQDFPAALAASQSAKPAQPATIDFAKIDQLIEDGEDVEANYQLSNLYWKQPEVRPQLLQRLRAVSYRIYFAPQPHYIEGHVVQPGDVLQNIARENKVSWEYLAKLNRTDAKKIRPGQKLKLIRGPFSAVVDLSDHEMTVHSQGHFVAVFPVGVGQDNPSPVGTFKVTDKQRDPVYYGAEGTVPSDDPKNPLGGYLLDLGDGIGIHGTTSPASIGKTGGLGSISLKSRDIADVYDLLTVGSEVLIKR